MFVRIHCVLEPAAVQLKQVCGAACQQLVSMHFTGMLTWLLTANVCGWSFHAGAMKWVILQG